MKETELYEPVKCFLEGRGYSVKAEIDSLDILAVKEEAFIAVELKVNISLKLIYQVIERQKLVNDVYIAVPESAVKSHKKNMKKLLLLLKRLSIGLMIVHENTVEVKLDPIDYNLNLSKNRSKRKRTKLINDFIQLKSNKNIGGSKGKRMTLYKENVIEIAKVLSDNPGLSPKDIKEKTGIEKTSSILQKNYYQWFKKISYGSYALSDEGEKEILKYISPQDIDESLVKHIG